MRLLKLSLLSILIVLSTFLVGCESSLSGKIDVTNKKLESGETTNMYVTVTYNKAFLGGKPQTIHMQFLSGEGLEVKKDSLVITEDKIEVLDGATTKFYNIGAKNIKANQILDSITIILTSDDNKIFKMISDPIVVTPKRS